MLGVTGTAISIDTACSSSLVSLIYGAKSVANGEEQMGLCFGVQGLSGSTSENHSHPNPCQPEVQFLFPWSNEN